MIKKITIRDVASYDHEGVTFDDLAKVNFIFGGNGTGKTTLSRLLQIAGQARNEGGLTPGSTRRLIDGPFKHCHVEWEVGWMPNVLVYNQDFKQRNLKEGIPGVFTLGEQYIEAERKLDYWRERRDECYRTEMAAYKRLNEAEKQLKDEQTRLQNWLWGHVYLPNQYFSGCLAGYDRKVSFAEKVKSTVAVGLAMPYLLGGDIEYMRLYYKDIFIDEDDTPDNPNADTLRMERENLTRDVWRYLAEQAEKEVKSSERKLKKLKKAYEQCFAEHEQAMRSLSQVDMSIRSQEGMMTSLQPTINRINRMLASHGFTGFSIQPSPTSYNGYQIQRDDGSFVEGSLSEGEQTFITLLYYIQLAQGATTEYHTDTSHILVIDDPISSLDSTVMLLASELIGDLIAKARKGERAGGHRIEQVFVLTHNRLFHKQVSTWRPRKDTHYWLLSKPGGVTRAKACGMGNPVRSDYAMLWQEVKEVSLMLKEGRGGEMLARRALGLPNIMRRIIEYYFVEIGCYKMYRLIPDSFTSDPEEQAIAQSLARWYDEGSHGVADDLYADLPQVDAARYLEVFHRLFAALGQEGHYEMMMRL